MDDKELVEVWRSEFHAAYGKGIMDGDVHIHFCKESAWAAFYAIKRSQPSVVLPKKWTDEYGNDHVQMQRLEQRLTAAGIKYTIGE